MLPIADDAEALELLTLHLDPVLGEGTALRGAGVTIGTSSLLRLGAVALFDLPLDRQAVAVPAGDVVGVLAQHLLARG